MYSPKALLKHLTPNEQQFRIILQSRQEAKMILRGEDPRKVIVIGPCSIHNYENAIDYGVRLKAVQESVKDTLLLIMRVYVEKPRTTTGWKGFLYDPHLNGTDDILEGARLSRKLLLELAEIGIPTATEFVNPIASSYLKDLITWGFIGARTSSSQIHRELVSSLDMPVGFKNTTEGNLQLAIDGAITARNPHTFLGIDEDGKIAALLGSGNPDTHIVLRGSDTALNFDCQSIESAIRLQKRSGLHAPLMVDCAHGNSKKNHLIQEKVFRNVVQQICEKNPYILGIMAESYLEGGSQAGTIDPKTSITDPCMSWETTEHLIRWCNAQLQLHSNLDPHDVLPSVHCSPLGVQ